MLKRRGLHNQGKLEAQRSAHTHTHTHKHTHTYTHSEVRLFPQSVKKIFALLSLSSACHVFHLVKVEDHSRCLSPLCMQHCALQQAMSNSPISLGDKDCTCVPLITTQPVDHVCLERTMPSPCWQLECALFCDRDPPLPFHYSPTSNGDN